LNELPKTLQDLHDEIYRRILGKQEESSVIAKKALSWLLCVRQRLHSNELLAAVSLGLDQQLSIDELLRLCRHLVILNEVSDSFELAHLSVREYLETREEYTDGQPDALVAEQCIKLFEPDIPRGILDPYASLYWPDHYSSAPQREGSALTNVAKKLFRNEGDNEGFKAWAKAAESSSKSIQWGDLFERLKDSNYKPLSVVCVFGFPELLDQWMDPKPGTNYFHHPDMVAHLAIKWGNKEVIRLLLQNDSQSAVDKFGFTSFFWAALYQQQPVLEVLKEIHGNLDAEDNLGWTAVHWMVFLGRVEGLRTLLEAGAGLDLMDQAKWTPLHWAAFIGNETEAKELVARGHRLDAKDDDKLTPFQWARIVGNEATAKHLKKSAADDSSGPTLSQSQEVCIHCLEPHNAFLTV
jgi:ankyrin repeat protein